MAESLAPSGWVLSMHGLNGQLGVDVEISGREESMGKRSGGRVWFIVTGVLGKERALSSSQWGRTHR